MRFVKTGLMVTLAAGLGVPACGMGTDDGSAWETSTSALNVSLNDYGADTNLSPNLEISEAPQATSTCLLVGLGGTMQQPTGSEWSHIGTYPTKMKTNWWTFVSTNAGHRWSRARCLLNTTTAQRSYFAWYSGNWVDPTKDPPVDMGPSNDRICWINDVTGPFGSTEQVRIQEVNGHWFLDGTTSLTPTRSRPNDVVGAVAFCLTGVSPSERTQEYTLTPPANGTSFVDTSIPNTTNRPFCGFTKIGGKFDGDGDSFWTGTSAGSAFWRLRGSSNDSRVTAGIRCIVKDAF